MRRSRACGTSGCAPGIPGCAPRLEPRCAQAAAGMRSGNGRRRRCRPWIPTELPAWNLGAGPRRWMGGGVRLGGPGAAVGRVMLGRAGGDERGSLAGFDRASRSGGRRLRFRDTVQRRRCGGCCCAGRAPGRYWARQARVRLVPPVSCKEHRWRSDVRAGQGRGQLLEPISEEALRQAHQSTSPRPPSQTAPWLGAALAVAGWRWHPAPDDAAAEAIDLIAGVGRDRDGAGIRRNHPDVPAAT